MSTTTVVRPSTPMLRALRTAGKIDKSGSMIDAFASLSTDEQHIALMWLASDASSLNTKQREAADRLAHDFDAEDAAVIADDHKPVVVATPKPTGRVSKPKTTIPAPEKPTGHGKPKTAKTGDALLAENATALLRHNGAYANASGVSAKQIMQTREALSPAGDGSDGYDPAALLMPKKPTKAGMLRLANGEQTPNADERDSWRLATKLYGQLAFGMESGGGTKNKMTGRKMACVLYVLAHAS